MNFSNEQNDNKNEEYSSQNTFQTEENSFLEVNNNYDVSEKNAIIKEKHQKVKKNPVIPIILSILILLLLIPFIYNGFFVKDKGFMDLSSVLDSLFLCIGFALLCLIWIIYLIILAVSKKKNKEKKWWIPVLIIILIIPIPQVILSVSINVIPYLKSSPKISKKIDTYLVNGEQKKLNRGDELVVDYWNNQSETLNGKELNGQITIYKGIKIGSSKTEVINKFDLNSKNTQYDCEIPNDSYDGTTEIIIGRYTEDIFKSNYLDCYLLFGYKNGKRLDYSEIDKIQKQSKMPRGVIIYNIGINGSDNEFVSKGKVIEFALYRY